MTPIYKLRHKSLGFDIRVQKVKSEASENDSFRFISDKQFPVYEVNSWLIAARAQSENRKICSSSIFSPSHGDENLDDYEIIKVEIQRAVEEKLITNDRQERQIISSVYEDKITSFSNRKLTPWSKNFCAALHYGNGTIGIMNPNSVVEAGDLVCRSTVSGLERIQSTVLLSCLETHSGVSFYQKRNCKKAAFLEKYDYNF